LDQFLAKHPIEKAKLMADAMPEDLKKQAADSKKAKTQKVPNAEETAVEKLKAEQAEPAVEEPKAEVEQAKPAETPDEDSDKTE